MATSSFYNDNLYRTYPFVTAGLPKIPHEWLVGIKVCCDYSSGFPAFPTVRLLSWQTQSEGHALRFLCEAKSEGAAFSITKIVTIPADTSCFERVLSDDSAGIQIIIIAGNLPQSADVSVDLQVEPTSVLWFPHRGISSVQTGNRPRRFIPLPDGLDQPHYGNALWWKRGERPTGEEAVDESTAPSKISGVPLLFSPGFNCRVHARGSRRLQIEAGFKAGLGEVTEDISKGCADTSFVFGVDVGEQGTICEEPPTEYLRKDGLPNYENALYAFCGALGPHIQLVTSSTVSLTLKPEEHTLVVCAGNLGGSAC